MPIDSGDPTWMLISTGLVMLMMPALGFSRLGLSETRIFFQNAGFLGLVIQAIGVAVAPVVGFLGTVGIMKVVEITIGLKASEKEADMRLDSTQHAEWAYAT